MKEYVRELARSAASPPQARNLVREYLQARILGALQRAGAMIPLAFQGGTALRFLYQLARYSEDLDFALEGNRARYDFRAYLDAIRSEFTAEGYGVEVKVNDARTVHSAFVRFPGLLYELGSSPQRGEMLAVKLEVDTQPPAGAGLETTIVRRHVVLQLLHHDRASLLAGKLHALLQRPYTKGRDLYDLIWYLSDPQWSPPNLDLLNHALAQTGWKGSSLTEANWRRRVWEKIQAVHWTDAVRDVRPFLERPDEAEFITQENVKRLLRVENE